MTAGKLHFHFCYFGNQVYYYLHIVLQFYYSIAIGGGTVPVESVAADEEEDEGEEGAAGDEGDDVLAHDLDGLGEAVVVLAPLALGAFPERLEARVVQRHVAHPLLVHVEEVQRALREGANSIGKVKINLSFVLKTLA